MYVNVLKSSLASTIRAGGFVGQEQALRQIEATLLGSVKPYRLCLMGSTGSGKRRIAQQVADILDRELVFFKAEKQTDFEAFVQADGCRTKQIMCILNAEKLDIHTVDSYLFRLYHHADKPGRETMSTEEYVRKCNNSSPSRTPLQVILLCSHSVTRLDGGVELARYSSEELHTIAREYAEKKMFSIIDSQIDMVIASTAWQPRAKQPLTLIERLDDSTRTPGAVLSSLNRLMQTDVTGFDEQKIDNFLNPSKPKAVMPIDFNSIVAVSTSNSMSEFHAHLMLLDGRAFEKFICVALERKGFAVSGARPGKDGGIDITARLKDPLFGGKFLFQCKRYKMESKIGRPVLQEFIGATHADREHPRLIFITTSSFTPDAVSYASSTGVQLIDIVSLQKFVQEGESAAARSRS